MHLLVSIYTCGYHSSFLKKCKISLKSGLVNGPVLELQHLVSGFIYSWPNLIYVIRFFITPENISVAFAATKEHCILHCYIAFSIKKRIAYCLNIITVSNAIRKKCIRLIQNKDP